MKEIPETSLENYGYTPTGQTCSCGGNLLQGAVRCPDGRVGCLVMHYGYVCDKCGKQFTD